MADLIRALEAVAQRVLGMAAQDPDLRAQLRELAQALLAATVEPAPVAAAPEPVEEQPAPPLPAEPMPAAPAAFAAEETPRPNGTVEAIATEPIVAEVPAPPPARVDSAVIVPPSRPVQPVPEVPRPPRFPIYIPSSEVDFQLIEARCRLKAEGTRWALTRRRKLAEGAHFRTEIAPGDADIISRARELPDCFLWMNQPGGPSLAEPPLLEDVAGCFEAVADACALVRLVLSGQEHGRDVLERVLNVTAEAQSALRGAILRVGGPTDKDQGQVFSWLRATTEEQRVFIPRYMRLEDVADASKWAEIRARISAVRSNLENARQIEKQRKKLFGKVGYHLKKMAAATQAEQQDHWQAITVAVDDLVKTGVPPSNTEIRDLLLPVLEEMPALPEVPKGFQLVLREIDRYLANRRAEPETVSAPPPNEDVAQVARLLAGKRVALIGGECRQYAKTALEEAFGLEELYWIETREHQTIEGFEPIVARPDVAVVLLAIKWSSHSYGDVRVFCERHGKPLVRLPGGYNPNQVAHQILAQCGERLSQTS